MRVCVCLRVCVCGRITLLSSVFLQCKSKVPGVSLTVGRAPPLVTFPQPPGKQAPPLSCQSPPSRSCNIFLHFTPSCQNPPIPQPCPRQDATASHDGNRASMDNILDGSLDFEAPMPRVEYEERIRLAVKLESTIRKTLPLFQLNAAMFSALMVAPLGRLQSLIDTDDPDSLRSNLVLVRTSLNGMHNLLRVCNYILSLLHLPRHALTEALVFRGPGTVAATPAEVSDRTSSGSRKRPRSHSSRPLSPGHAGRTTSSTDKSRPRNSIERHCALRRDGEVCVITGTSSPQVCHIVPFSWTENKKNCGIVQSAMYDHGDLLWQRESMPAEELCELYRAPSSSDQSWNMLSLSPLLHVWWARPYFGLEYLGRLPPDSDDLVSVELRFRWLLRDKFIRPETAILLDKERDYHNCLLSRIWSSPDNHTIAARFITSGRQVLTGHTFFVRIPAQHVSKFIAAIKVQWALTQVAAMCGFAEAEDDDNDPDHAVREATILDWLRDVSGTEGCS